MRTEPVLMLPEADMVVRHFVPVVLEAAGASAWARELRDSRPVHDAADVGAAACLLKAVRSCPGGEPAWKPLLADCLFWAEAAVWAAAAGDMPSFQVHVEKVRDSLSRGESLTLLH